MKKTKPNTIISWDEFFMGLASMAALRSKDPSSQVGACIADKNKKVVSIGYNGMPRHCPENKLTWNKREGTLDCKYLYVCHAEFNAILNAKEPLDGCTIYVNLFPCNECAKAIIQVGIKEVVYASDKYANLVSTKASKKLLKLAGVKIRKFKDRSITHTVNKKRA